MNYNRANFAKTIPMKISIASDHAGYELKEILVEWLKEKGFAVENEGPFSGDSVDYPDYAHKTASKVNAGLCEKGIVICGSGNGVSMTANKYANVRAALCWNEEITRLARLHNDANILGLPARFISTEEAMRMTEIFLSTEFEGGRHQNRINKINRML